MGDRRKGAGMDGGKEGKREEMRETREEGRQKKGRDGCMERGRGTGT